MSTSTLPYATSTSSAAGVAAAVTPPGAGPTVRPRRPGFWRAPFSAVTFREIGYVLTSFPLAIAGFVFAVTMFCLGAGLLVTLFGLPVLAVALAGARGLGSAERLRARVGLGLTVDGPGAYGARAYGAGAGADGPRVKGFWARTRARLADAAGWKALLFQVVMFPWRVLSFVLTVTFFVTGWVVALFPTYSWVFHRYVGWPGYRVYDFTSGGRHHEYYITSPAQIAAVAGIGAVLVLLTPKLVRALTSVDRAAVRSLLG
ncbi:sensor domain-containing protein [Streptomyces sp. NPDC005865]|uniref:sensor domain-containing protein n=1 Tax=Streptomyces sp. NPDC005865 TaxID=3155453 RepID=UPI0034075E31